MPRGSAAVKRQQGLGGPNVRDTRHENGSVRPGKRIAKQKSQSQLNENDTNPSASTDDVSLLPPLANSTHAGIDSRTAGGDMALDADTSRRRGSTSACSEFSSNMSLDSRIASGHTPGCDDLEDNHRRIDVNATKIGDVHRDTGPLDFALTVLKSCPLQDTIAIMIILMQLPSIFLSAIYVLFTILTFVSSNTAPSFNDVFEWNIHTPSIATVVCVDGIVLLIWLFLWTPLQKIVLDLAQMVIALGLGGGSSTTEGCPWRNSLICLSMIILPSILRHNQMKYSLLRYLASSRFWTPKLDLDDPLEGLDKMRDHAGFDRMGGGVDWVKCLLAIHILTQGLIKCVRDWYLRRERRDSMAVSVDPEAGRPYTVDPSNDGGLATPDSDMASVQPALLNSKKKRKQVAQIRQRQPLWAAIASTKVVVVKEYELSHNAIKPEHNHATDLHNLGNAPFNTQPQQIWISYVGCDEVCFNTSHFPDFEPVEAPLDVGISSTVDTPMPFYVRVNNAVWQPTHVTQIRHATGTTWTGDIYGLTPMCNYECEFVSTVTHEVLFSTGVRTTQAKSAMVDTSVPMANGQRSLRPDSPSTTLKTSIAAAETRLAEEKARQKGQRKEWQRKTNTLKKENERLSTAVQSAGAGDDKLRQKVQQNTTQQKQAEQAMTNLEGDLQEMETIPATLKAAWRSKQSAFSGDKAVYENAHAEFQLFKTTVDSQVKALLDDKVSLEAKRVKISSRISKVEGEHARIADANARGMDEAQRRRQEQATLQAQLSGVVFDLADKMKASECRVAAMDRLVVGLEVQIGTYQSGQAAFLNGSYGVSELSATGQLPGAVDTVPSTQAAYDTATAWNTSTFNASPWGPSPPGLGFAQQPSPLAQGRTTVVSRGRSSSMLSDVSGFTMSSEGDDDEFLIAARPHFTQEKVRPSSSQLSSIRPPPGFGYSPRLRANEEAVSLCSKGGSPGSGPSQNAGSVTGRTSPAPDGFGL